MFALTLADQDVLVSLAKEHCRDGEKAETAGILIDGFSRYGEEALVKSKKTYVSREEFFRDKCRSLLENIGFAGQSFDQVFSSGNGRDELCQLVRCCVGVHISDIEDIVQDICWKFAKAKWVERYNPLISSWRNFLLVPIQRYVNTYKLIRSKKVTTGAVSLDRDDDGGSYRNTAALRLYTFNEDESPENVMAGQEVLEAFETFLRSQKPMRQLVSGDFRKMCTILPPGTSVIPVQEEENLFFLQGGPYNSRVTNNELYESGITTMVPNHLLVDYITEDPVDHTQCVDEVTGDFITQKDFPNPNYDAFVIIKEQRTWMDLYNLLRQGLQVEEIAHELRMAPPSIPARIQKLESLFRDFWLASTTIPRKRKILAAKTYKCPHCRRLTIVEREECSSCGADMRAEVAEVRFNAYPWSKVYVTRETYERLGKRRQALVVQRGSLSIRF